MVQTSSGVLMSSIISHFPLSTSVFIGLIQPIAPQALQPSGPVGRVEVQAWRHKVGHLLGVLGREVVLLVQDLVSGPELELFDVLEVTLLVEEVLGVLPSNGEFLGHFAEELLEHGEVVLIAVVVLASTGVEKEVSCEELKGDTPC